MESKKRLITTTIIFVLCTCSIFSFDRGWVLNMRANVGGSATTPFISSEDLSKLGANKMEGMVGFIGGGTAEVGYIFDNETYFNLPKDHYFSGMGLFGRIGVTQGYSGQISGTNNELTQNQQVDVFVNVYYTPVITFGAATKAYFFKNRLAIGLGLGSRMIADTAPNYEIYSNQPDTIPAEVGTIIVDEWMVKNINPFMINTELFAEYNVNILPTTELILGGYVGYNIYSPKYITMPGNIMDMLMATSKDFNPQEPLTSYFINSFDFGLIFSLGFRLE